MIVRRRWWGMAIVVRWRLVVAIVVWHLNHLGRFDDGRMGLTAGECETESAR